MSYHYPWPGYGHVAKTGEGFHYIAEPMVDGALTGRRSPGMRPGPLPPAWLFRASCSRNVLAPARAFRYL